MLTKIISKSFSTAGSLLTWGVTTHGWGRPANNQHFTPNFVDGFSNITSVSTGEYHLGFITSDKAVYTVGLADDGRLGQADAYDSELPRRVPFEHNQVQIQQLSCGNRHSVALSSDGSIYTWGYGKALGVHGLNGKAPLFSKSPIKLDSTAFGSQKIVKVAAARDFCAALTASGKLYGWGTGLYDALIYNNSLTPVEIVEFSEICRQKHAKIVKFAAIDRFIIILLDSGRLYAVGKNNQGVTGTRKNPLILDDHTLYHPTKIVDKHFHGEKVVDFESSANATIMVTDSGKVFYTGMFSKFQPTPFPLDIKAKKIFAAESSVGVISEDNKVYYINEKIIDDSDFYCHKNKVYICEDEKFSGQVLDIGGTYHLRYALVK